MEEEQTNPPILSTTLLYDASLKGDVNALHILLNNDPLILDRCIIEKSDRFTQSPLHVSSNYGHLEFTAQLLGLKPDLTRHADDTTRSTALHLASAKGHLDIVEKLLEVNPGMCLARDIDGRNPIHVAAINGHLHVLDLLVRTNPLAAQERTNCGESVLHMCVKYGQFENLKYLVNVKDDSELLNSKDGSDNTVLHLAVIAKQFEVVKILVGNKKLQQNLINKNGLTPLDWLLQNGRTTNDREITRILKRAKALESKSVLKRKDKNKKWSNKQNNALMVVASLIATMAFQIGVNPPGGAWQDDSNPNKPDGHTPHLVGMSIMANRDPDAFQCLQVSNTISFISSLSVVLLLISGIPCKRLFVVLLMLIMFVAIAATASAFNISSRFLNRKYRGGSGSGSEAEEDTTYFSLLVSQLVAVWVILVILALIVRVLYKPIKNKVCNK